MKAVNFKQNLKKDLVSGSFFLYSKDSDKIDFREKTAEITLKKTCSAPNPKKKTLNQKKIEQAFHIIITHVYYVSADNIMTVFTHP